MQASGYISDVAVSLMPLTTESYRGAPKSVSAAIKANSWLAGCLAGGAKKIKAKHLRCRLQAVNIGSD